ncbi:hypothetical protein CKO25_12795 [Thiocapsa imhoffii]|uniref:Uncharacterized protein n=1 Tax=Thiocapsa imhoffii TaxID=382777 RepID=A0A9X0WJ88_9GAMM|nr:hypothetical protein [Thiocapsa imhoffii]
MEDDVEDDRQPLARHDTHGKKVVGTVTHITMGLDRGRIRVGIIGSRARLQSLLMSSRGMLARCGTLGAPVVSTAGSTGLG